MTKLKPLLLLAFLLLPATARADGLIDWLEKWSGPSLFGAGFDLHLFCGTKEGRALPLCERVFVLRETRSADIRHIVDLRAVWYWKREDQRFDDDPTDTRSVRAQRLESFYHFRVTPVVDIGAGVGFLRVSGDGFEAFTRGIVTPASVGIAPFVRSRVAAARIITFRLEETYITTGFKGADFGNSKTAFNTRGGEWNFSASLVFDLGRIR